MQSSHKEKLDEMKTTHQKELEQLMKKSNSSQKHVLTQLQDANDQNKQLKVSLLKRYVIFFYIQENKYFCYLLLFLCCLTD